MTRKGASAPGKALLCGEYAVLEGASAVVAAVDRRVTVHWTDEAAAMTPEVEATLSIARGRCGSVPGSLIVDARALRAEEAKIGLGSSAAAAAATSAAVFASCGFDLTDPGVAHEVFDCALRGHAAVAPRGSGVDVAASTFGGFLRFRRGTERPDVQSLCAPAGLSMSLVWTGRPARTSELVAKVYELRTEAADEYRARMGELAAIAEAFAEAFGDGDLRDIVRCAASYGDAMAALGAASGAPIVEARLRRTSELARRFSGSAKPCGAGGGDVAIAFFTDPEGAERFQLACETEGLHPIGVSWGAPGAAPR